MSYDLAIDLGGTSCKYGLLDEKGGLIPESMGKSPSHSDASPQEIFDSIRWIIKANPHVGRVGVCVPGPFDYTKGIFQMDHKFQHVKGMSLTPVFQEFGLEPVYLHDSTAYILGEMFHGSATDKNSCCCIMLGTGFGFSLSVHRKVLVGYDQRPTVSMWNKPYGKGIVEDYISRRRMIALYKEISGTSETVDVKDIAMLADKGDSSAQTVFHTIGTAIPKVLHAFIPESLYEHTIILGGQIANASKWIVPGILEENPNLHVLLAKHLADASLYGIGAYLRYGKAQVVKEQSEEELFTSLRQRSE